MEDISEKVNRKGSFAMTDIISRLSDRKSLPEKFEAGGTNDPEYREILLEKSQMNPYVLQAEITKALNERDAKKPRKMSRDIPF